MSESGFFVTPGDRHPVSGSHLLVHLFHYGDWDLRFFPVGWDFQIAEIDWRFFSWLSLCATDFFMRYLYSFQGLSSPVLACFAGCVLPVFCCFCLDEDCIPGWGECGRPLRL